MYSPSLPDNTVRKLYRLARVRGLPMTKLLDTIVTEHITASSEELARYRPETHDRRGRSTNEIHRLMRSD